MTIDADYDFSSSDDLDFGSDESSSEFDSIAEFELDSNSADDRKSKQNNKRSFLEKKKRIEQLQEERRLKKFDEDYDDWD